MTKIYVTLFASTVFCLVLMWCVMFLQPGCPPEPGDTADDVRQACGWPSRVQVAINEETGDQVEWSYHDIVVVMHAGVVMASWSTNE